MSVAEAKTILLLYRPGTADVEDPQVVEALALAESSPELTAWLEAHGATQTALRGKFRQITPPAGLKEQIISEHAASKKTVSPRPRMQFTLAVVAVLVLGMLGILWYSTRLPLPENTLAFYKHDMVAWALRSYQMNVTTNALAPIRAFLDEKHAPADFNLPPGLQKAELVGCAEEPWQGANVSMICFRTGKPVPPGVPADLWLIVVDRASVKDAPNAVALDFAKVNRLITATWAEGDKLYFLGIAGSEGDLKQYL
jgi:hypothetical protein